MTAITFRRVHRLSAPPAAPCTGCGGTEAAARESHLLGRGLLPASMLRVVPFSGASSAGRHPTLSKDHPCSTGFLDETGAIANDRIFAVGLLKVPEPAPLLRAVQKWRDRKHWYNEVKFTAVTRDSLDLYKRVIDTAMSATASNYFCFVADRDVADPVERFGSHWDAYTKLAEQLVVASVKPPELVSILADNYSTPDDVLFEETLRANANRRLRRLAVVSVCRLDSKSADGLQVVDLITSAIALEFRIEAGLAKPGTPKAMLAAHVRAALGAGSCLSGWRTAEHSVAIYNHGKASESMLTHPPAVGSVSAPGVGP